MNLYKNSRRLWWDRICKIMCIYSNNKCMCVFLISPVPIAEPLTSELIDTPVFHNLAPRPIKYRVSVPIPTFERRYLYALVLSNLKLCRMFSFTYSCYTLHESSFSEIHNRGILISHPQWARSRGEQIQRASSSMLSIHKHIFSLFPFHSLWL